MKITKVKAVRTEYPRIPQKTKPRKADKYAGKIATGSPMSTSLGGRYFHTEGWWDHALMKGVGAGIERDVGCIVECEHGSWGFGFSDRASITA